MDKTSKIYITGHTGLVGTALIETLRKNGYTNIITRNHKDLDLLDQSAVYSFFEKEKPDFVFHLAAKVGGIVGNKTYPADFIYENIQINTNVIHSAHLSGVKKLINLGSVCIYPVLAPTPIKEDYLLTGPLEYTNEGYALAKISALMMCKKYYEQYGDKFISVMPANLYGPNDNFHPQNAHVIPMLMQRFHDAKKNNLPNVTVWGTGKPTRDFLYSYDLADGLVFIMNNYDENKHINISTGIETSIKELVSCMSQVTNFTGEIIFDTTKPDGTPKRYMDITNITNLGWKPKYTLEMGLENMYEWFKNIQK